MLGTLLAISRVLCQGTGTEEDARKYLNELEFRYSEACNKEAVASFGLRINITDHGKKALVSQHTRISLKIPAAVF